MSVELSKHKERRCVTEQGECRTRWGATLTNGKGQVHHTFTWAETREDACRRMAELIAQSPDLWRDWTYTVADKPSVTVQEV
ncbi:hypothetical protein OG381_34460 [Streptomyces sp. NBC_00490]|uniref:hypothetical protein n=1 Tax=Streptomyces sp. NBC_00490 TaxID=2903657 RepID=UPI002E19A108